MRRRPLILLAALLAGCAAPGASEAPSEPTASASASEAEPMPSQASVPASASAAASASAEAAGGLFAWPDGDEPIVTPELAGLGERYVNPGAVIDHEGVLHMYANVFTAWPGTVQVVHLTSTDGAEWALAQPEPIMTTADVPFTSEGHDVSSGFVTDDGTWVLVFTTVSASEPWVIGLATAPGPEGPWSVVPEPVLVGAGAEGGEEGGLTWPSVVPTDDGWAMYFAVIERRGNGGTIAMATSIDGLTWERQPEPVLVADVSTWELTGLDRPRVARTDDGGYVMVYAGRILTDRGLAVSTDGVTWERVGDGPAMTQDDFPVPNSDAWDAALIVRDGVMTYFLEVGYASTSGTDVHRAVAPVPKP